MSSKIIMNVRFQFGRGVQATLIPVMKNDDILVKYLDPKQGRGCAIIKPKVLKQMTESNNSIYETIVSYPCKVFFDVDGKIPNECNLEIIKPIINKYFNNPKMAISGYESENKNSYHIVLPDLLIKDYDDLINMKKLVKKMKNENKYFDTNVYTKNREMKAVNQSKPNANVQKIIENENTEDHYITCFINENAKPFIFDITDDDNQIDLSNLPIATKELNESIKRKIVNFTPADHDNALKLLQLVPCDENNDECYKFVNFCFHNNITIDECYEWLKQKDVNCRSWLVKKWNEQKADAKWKASIGWIKSIVNIYCPNFHCLNDAKTSKFMYSFDLPSVKIPVRRLPTFETADIQLKHYETPHKTAIFNIGMGGGKTGSTVKYLKDTNKSFVWLSVRQALAKNTYKRFQDDKLDCYNYLDIKGHAKEGAINCARSLLISTESLHLLHETNKFDVLVVDEIESLLNNWDSITHGEKVEANFFNFTWLFKDCKKIILLDAFTTTKTINFLKSLGIEDIITYSCDYKKTERKLIENDSFDDIFNKMVDDLNNKRKIFVFYPFLGSTNKHDGIKDLQIKLMNACKTKPKIQTYNSKEADKVQKELYNVATIWKDLDAVITTSSITVGVNYEGDDFHKVYLLTSGKCNLARDVTQVSLRIRSPRCSDIEMYFFDKMTNEMYEYNEFYLKKTDQIYNSLIDDVVTEKLSNFTASFFKYADLSGFIRKDIKAVKDFKKTSFNAIEDEKKNVVKVIMSYNAIEDITEQEFENIQHNKIFKSEATMEDKFMVSKFYFDKKFKKLTAEDRKFIWNNRLNDQIENFNHEVVKKIEKDNNCRVIDLDLKKISVSEDTNKYVSEKFHEFKHKNDTTKILKILNFKIMGFSGSDESKNLFINEEIKHLYGLKEKNEKVENLFVDE